MRKRAARIVDASSRNEEINFKRGPTAMSERADKHGPVATRMIFDNDDVAMSARARNPFGGPCAMVQQGNALRSR